MIITLSVTPDFLETLDKKRGLISRSAYIRNLIMDKPAQSKPQDKYQNARDFCNKVKLITYDIDFQKQQELDLEAKSIAKELGLEIKGQWFYDPETDKFLFTWKK